MSTERIYKLTIVSVSLLAVVSLIGLFLVGAFVLSNSAIVFAGDSGRQISSVVYIAGAVEKPGVYRLNGEMRLTQLVDQAGGVLANADQEWLARQANLASKLKDEEHIFIPFAEQKKNTDTPQSGNSQETNGKVNINTASKVELETLPGVGSATADKIIAARPFESIENLQEVSGIGDSKYAQLVGTVTL